MTEKAEALLKKLSRYTPTDKDMKFFEAVENFALRPDSERRILEMRVRLDKIMPKAYIYKIENEIKTAYELEFVWIYPEYPSELFTMEYLPEIFTEAKRAGAVINGFFGDYSAAMDDDGSLTVGIPFPKGGLNLLDLAKSADIISAIIKSEFSIDVPVEIVQRSDFEEKYNEVVSAREAYLREAAEAARQAAIAAAMAGQNAPADNAAEEETVALPRIASLFEGEDTIMQESDTTILSGKMRFNIDGAEQIYGEAFRVEDAVPLRSLTSPQRNVVTIGEIFSVETRDTRKGDKTGITIGITDKDSSIYLKLMLPIEAAAEFMGVIGKGKGKAVAVKGNVKLDDFSGDLQFSLTAMMQIKRILRADTAEEKRVELHMHTNLSAMDATALPADIVKTAARFGHPAVAITDHGNLQGFPTAMLAAEDLCKSGKDIKVLYGLEAYFVDDTAKAIYGPAAGSFKDTEFIVFDIETTGLSNRSDKITEIGAVLVKNGECRSY